MTKILAQLDLAAGLKTKNIVVPAMPATVTWENSEALKGYDEKKEKIILQALIAEAIGGLKASQKEVQAAIADFDTALARKPSATKAEAAERVKTFATVCKQITSAQEAKVQKAVEACWAQQQKRDAALRRINLIFAAKIIVSAISLSASIAVAALSMGTLAVTLVGAAKTVVTTALLIKDFAAGRDKAAEEVFKLDQALWKIYMGPKMKGKAFRSASEVAAAAGVPFIDSVGKLETKTKDFLGKSARVDSDRQKLYENANALLAAVKKLDAGKVGEENAQRLKTMGDRVTGLLDSIHELAGTVAADDAFHATLTTRIERYRALDGKALAAGSAAVTIGVLAAGIAATAKSIVEVAIKLA